MEALRFFGGIEYSGEAQAQEGRSEQAHIQTDTEATRHVKTPVGFV